MMKLAVTALTLFLALNLSQAKTSADAQVQVFRKHSVSTNQTQTKNVLVLAVKKTQRRFVVNDDLDDNHNELPGSDELDLQVPYRRPTIVDVPVDVEEPLSDYVLVRLAVARAKAMAQYHQSHL